MGGRHGYVAAYIGCRSGWVGAGSTRREPGALIESPCTAVVDGLSRHQTTLALPADIHQVDETTGQVRAVLEEAYHPSRVQPGRLIVAGDADEPFTAGVVDIVPDGAEGRSERW